jgi:hypothetical protein
VLGQFDNEVDQGRGQMAITVTRLSHGRQHPL